MIWRGSSNPNLERLAQSGRLHREPAAADEIAAFLAAADQQLGDAALQGLSVPGRFKFAYEAAHALALAALRANDYRPGKGEGHRVLVFQVLEHTLGMPKKTWVALSKYHEKRNAAEYHAVLGVTQAEADDVVALAKELRQALTAWLNRTRPELLR